MHQVVYDGSFNGFLSAVFDIYYYKFEHAKICRTTQYLGNLLGEIHQVTTNEKNSERLWQGLARHISPKARKMLYDSFLSELPGIENTLLDYIRYTFENTRSIEHDFSNRAVLMVQQTSRKVHREKHRMEAFVRFQKAKDNLYYALIDPDFNVLPLISSHFKKRYADQRWLIYDTHRKYGIYYDLQAVNEVNINFSTGVTNGKFTQSVYAEDEDIYQQLWQQYFKSVNIPARKNTKLHLQHMPRRYWKYLTEKQPV